MTEEEKGLMKRYGITTEQRTVYHYLGFTYEHLRDALNYAGTDQKRREKEDQPKA